MFISFFAAQVFASPLYKVEKDGKENWLLATTHVPIDADWLPPEVSDVIAKSRLVFAEIGDGSDTNLRRLKEQEHRWIMNYVKTGARRNVKKALPLQDYLFLKSVFDQFGARIENLNLLPPVSVINQVGDLLIKFEREIISSAFSRATDEELSAAHARGIQILNEKGLSDFTETPASHWQIMDFAILGIAQEHHIPVRSIETLEVALDSLMVASETEIVPALRTLIKRSRILKAEISKHLGEFYADKMMNSHPNVFTQWLRANPANPFSGVEREPVANLRPAIPLTRGDMARHEGWVNTIRDEFEMGGVLVVVGEVHVHGSASNKSFKSLIQIYEDQGYRVTRVVGPSSACDEMLSGI